MKTKTFGIVTRSIRAFFFLAFAVLTVRGIFICDDGNGYVVQNNDMPVLSVTVDAYGDDTGEDAIFVLGDGDGFPAVSAEAACVISADRGDVLYLKNGDAVLPMASTTKIMTALVAMEMLSPEYVFQVPPEVCGIEGSSIYLAPGEKLTVRDLLYGLLLESGNDAACALATAACGNIEDFVSAMNEKAAELGLVFTHFDNPHGLSSENHRTTARELAQITYHAMKIPLFREITGTKEYVVKDENGVPLKYFFNHNKMLRTYSGTTGVKTGYTIASGRCLVTSAKRNGSEFIVVTLNDRDDFRDHARLLDHAFENYRTHVIANVGEINGIFGGIEMKNSERVISVTEKDEKTTEAVVKITASES